MADPRPRLKTYFFQRDFSAEVVMPPLDYAVERYSFDAIGGPKAATIVATGNALGLLDLTNYLRAPVEIHDDKGRKVWWGMVSGLKLRIDNIEIGLSLKAMANRVAVTYNYPGGGQVEALSSATTSWAEDSTSVNEYGNKELMVSLAEASSARATGERDTRLALLKNPVTQADVRDTSGRNEAAIICSGWWSAFEWMYYSQSGTTISHTSLPDATQNVGDLTANTAVAQSFTVGSSDLVTNEVHVTASKVSSPGDNLTVALYSDSAGSPGALIDSGTISPSSLTAGDPLWQVVTLSGSNTLSASTTYWVHISRTGAVDSSNYYVVGVDEALGYAGGSFEIYDGSSWGSRSPDADMPFVVYGTWTTDAQIEQIITDADPGTGTTNGSFFTGYTVATTGLSSSPYRDGTSKAIDELEQLLANGTTNDLRLLATVDADRSVTVYEQPAQGDSDHFILADGSIQNQYGVLVPRHTCPNAFWVRPKDILSLGGSITTLANLAYLFIESSTYDVRTHRLNLRTHGTSNPFDVARISD